MSRTCTPDCCICPPGTRVHQASCPAGAGNVAPAAVCAEHDVTITFTVTPIMADVLIYFLTQKLPQIERREERFLAATIEQLREQYHAQNLLKRIAAQDAAKS